MTKSEKTAIKLKEDKKILALFDEAPISAEMIAIRQKVQMRYDRHMRELGMNMVIERMPNNMGERF